MCRDYSDVSFQYYENTGYGAFELLMEQCWSSRPAMRPTANEVVTACTHLDVLLMNIAENIWVRFRLLSLH